jgi:hypothetical protein
VRNFLISSRRAFAASLRAAACILSVAMLLSFPSARSLQFGQHFGTTEIRQKIVRHTFVAGPEAGGEEKIAHIDAQPTIPALVNILSVTKSFFCSPAGADIPTFRILRHLRLGASRSGSPDPLL